MARLTLLLMRSASGKEDLGATLERFLALTRDLLARPGGRESFRMLVRYTVHVTRPDDERAFVERIRRTVGVEASAMAETMGEYLIEKGEKKMLERQLRKKFGDLDEATLARLAGANQAELDQWADRVLVAKTLAGVFGRSRKPRSKK